MQNIQIKQSVFSARSIREVLAEQLRVKPESFKYFEITKKSLDARRKNDLHYLYSVNYSFNQEKLLETQRQKLKKSHSVLVVGAGPAGLFCALELIRSGAKVTIIERGESVENRKRDYERFLLDRKLNIESNLQFGEGGAGTFSDGKLNTGANSPYIKRVLRDFVKFGAPNEILYENKPHIGSDNLSNVVAALRNEVIALGGKVFFNTRLDGIEFAQNRAVKIKFSRNDEGLDEVYDSVVLAIGHSARDTFYKLYSEKVAMEKKPFAVGLRIEHRQEWLNIRQYGTQAHDRLPSADYKLVSNKGERSVFTFCMCPGGYVLPAASEENLLVVNGMSNYKRDGENCNSAVIAAVETTDFPSESPLSGIEFQRNLEKNAFNAGGGAYSAPIQLVGDFLLDKESVKLGEIKPTYPMGYNFYPLGKLFSKSIKESLKLGITDMNTRLNGFSLGQAVLTGVESRTSSPVRIVRNEKYESVTAENLYPCGEGAGYAGGIMSAAIDGIKVAEAIISKVNGEQ